MTYHEDDTLKYKYNLVWISVEFQRGILASRIIRLSSICILRLNGWLEIQLRKHETKTSISNLAIFHWWRPSCCVTPYHSVEFSCISSVRNAFLSDVIFIDIRKSHKSSIFNTCVDVAIKGSVINTPKPLFVAYQGQFISIAEQGIIERRPYICNAFNHWLRPSSAIDRKGVLIWALTIFAQSTLTD